VSRFRWPLQRLLDVRQQQESMARNRLVELAAQLARMRQRELVLQSQRRVAMEQLARLDVHERMVRQAMVMECVAAGGSQLGALAAEMANVRQRQHEARRRYRELRSQRESLEKLRERALEHYRREQEMLEQKQLDEAAAMAFARRAAANRLQKVS
jgi:flagellar export protein FliJ